MHGDHLGRGDIVSLRYPNLQCLGKTKHGHPRHPLYLPNTAPLEDYP